MVQGMGTVDARSAAARTLSTWRAQLEKDLGGRENLSAQRSCLLELVIRTRLLLDAADAFILGLPSVVNKRRRALLPIVKERMSLASALTSQLQALGLDRVPIDGGPIPAHWIQHVEPRIEADDQPESKNRSIEALEPVTATCSEVRE
jgi:hypothetical protein